MKQNILLDLEIGVEKVADRDTFISMLKQARKNMDDKYACFMGRAFDNYIVSVEKDNNFTLNDEITIKIKDNTYGPDMDIVCIKGGTWEEYFDNNAEFMVNNDALFYKGEELLELRSCLRKAGFNIRWDKNNSEFQSPEEIFRIFENDYYWKI
ncbi:MAG: hypothetical protein ACOX1F_01165 [Erysipelotrichaceae bacterium]|jgi:hypothetical protein